jgi:hypothetical protein
MASRRLVLAVGVLASVLALTACAASGDRVVAGTFTSDSDIRVTNLTIEGGHVTVGYSMDVLFEPQAAQTALRCGLVDTSGTFDFFGGSQTIAPAGTWTTLEFEADYELGELTLGIRCSPDADGALSVVFRDALIHASPID